MGTFSEILGAVGAVAVARAGTPVPGGLPAQVSALQRQRREADDAQFFSRAFDSVARKARQSVLLFPLVASDAISPAAASTLGKALQLRSAEYVRLAIANMDTLAVDGDVGKQQLISMIRGASLSGALFGEGAELEAVNRHLLANLPALVEEAARPPARLEPAIGRLGESGSEGEEEGGGDWDGWEGPPAAGGPETAQFLDQEEIERRLKGLSGAGDQAPRASQRVPNGAEEAPAPPAPPPRGGAGGREAGEKAAYSMAPGFDKVNQFLPVTLELTFSYRPAGAATGAQPVRATLLVAVKTQVHPVPSDDLVAGIGRARRAGGLFLQFLRLTSGEISFLRDFVLGLGDARAAAAPPATAGARVLAALRRQAEWNRARSNWVVAATTNRGFVPPTATIALTAEEVGRIRDRGGPDLSRPSGAAQLLQEHNLMGLAVVDESLGYVRLFEDGDEDFDRVPFSELESRGRETSVRDLMSIMAKR